MSHDTSVAGRLSEIRAEFDRLDGEGHGAAIDAWLAALLAKRRCS